MEVPGAALPATLVACLLRSTQAVFFSVRVFVFQVGVSGVFFFFVEGRVVGFGVSTHTPQLIILTLARSRFASLAPRSARLGRTKSRGEQEDVERGKTSFALLLAFCKMQEGERRRRLEAVSFALSQASRSLARDSQRSARKKKQSNKKRSREREKIEEKKLPPFSPASSSSSFPSRIQPLATNRVFSFSLSHPPSSFSSSQ